MQNLKWSDSEKKLAHRLFESALEAELSAVMAEFKAKAESATTPEAMWAVESYLTDKRRDIDQKYDYRYSQLIIVFSRLVRDGWLKEEQLHGLSEEKRSYIQRILSL